MNNQFDQNKILEDLKKQFPNPNVGSNFLSYDNTRFYSLNDTKNSDYSSIDEVGSMPPPREQPIEPRGHVYNRNTFMQPPSRTPVNQGPVSPSYPSSPTYPPSPVNNQQFNNQQLPQSPPTSIRSNNQQPIPRNVQPPPGFANRNINKNVNNITNNNLNNIPINNSSSNYYQCPQCQQLAVSTCGCQFKDSVCPNGHKWYKLSNGNKQFGPSPNHQ